MHHGCNVLRAVGEWVGLVADLAKLSLGREDYYLREIAENREEYLSGHGESPGRWYGAGAAALGQDGIASTEAFRRIFEGRHPDTGELLGRPHGRNAVPAFDVVLRPTKSVSILYGLGDAATGRAVLAAHHEGVTAAVTYPGRSGGHAPWAWRAPEGEWPGSAGGGVRSPHLP
jgi:TrwC relaxase